MKPFLRFITAVVFLLSSIPGMAQNFEDAGEYMNFLSKQQENITKRFMSYASASAHGRKASKVENLRSKLMNEVQESRMNINGMPSFKGDKSYRDPAVSFMKLYYNVLNEDYSKIVNMEEIAEQSYDGMEAYMLAKEMVDIKLEEGNAKMLLAQRKFAGSNNITLTENKSELEDMMKEVHEMNKYYNELYLIFFRPYKQEVYLMQAIEKGNITGIEQNKGSLLKYAQEGLEKLKTLKPYKGDNSLVTNCKNILNFYVKEADKATVASDFFLAKERFEAIKKEYEKKDEPGKQEVNDYNKAVNDINKASQTYNSNNNLLNQQRSETLNNWNKSTDQFFDNHTPHYD
ncbi:MAG: hypothetical protein H7X88_08410 [Gloeobacteraceae cyanobacterium ES-bin-316]|nr:hypothetical protein [Ferruginibacter sp.]